jgi:hypothetical protein
VSDKLSKPDRPLRTEIARLDEKLAEALKRATYIGLTPAEAKECASCHAELAKLTEQLLDALPGSPTVSLAKSPSELIREVRVVDHKSGLWWGLLGAVART